MDNAFIRACQTGQKTLIKDYLSRGADDLDFRDVVGNTALHYLCMGGETTFAEKVIAAGAKVNTLNDGLETPLHFAADSGSIGLIRMLLEKGADIDAQDREDRTPLIRAISAGKNEAAEYLISSGADRFSRTINGLTAVDFAQAEGMDTLLPFFENRFSGVDRKGNSPLHNAVYQNGISTVKNILSADTSHINARNNEGLTPLFVAVSRLNFGISELLLQYGANPNIPRPQDQYSPLHIAAENGLDWLGEILLDFGGDINAQNKEGASPLIVAVQSQQRDFALMLVRRGALLDVADQYERTASDYARESDFPAIAEVLSAS
jgi:ankyrin repeat protein